MRVTLLGTGSPIPTIERAGTGLMVHVDDEPLLVDCGPRIVHELVRNGIDLAEIRTLFFTHQHMDHNADFFHFAIASWSLGRESLTVYGPAGTDRLLDAMYHIYEEDLDYRRNLGYPSGGMENIEYVQTTDELQVTTDTYRVTAMAVDHSIETYAYRFENRKTGAVAVFSGDTRPIFSLSTFSEGADLLIQDACVGPTADDPDPEGRTWETYTRPLTDEHRKRLGRTHCDAADAGRIAAEAGVDQLVLSHLLPYRDTEAMYDAATGVFDGQVIVGEDGATFDI